MMNYEREGDIPNWLKWALTVFNRAGSTITAAWTGTASGSQCMTIGIKPPAAATKGGGYGKMDNNE